MRNSAIWNYLALYGGQGRATHHYLKEGKWFRPHENRPSLAVIRTQALRKTVLIKKAA